MCIRDSFFQSIGKAKLSIFLSLTRQLLFLAPCLLILPRFFELKMCIRDRDMILKLFLIFMILFQR